MIMSHQRRLLFYAVATAATISSHAATTAVWQGGDGSLFGDSNWTVNSTPDQFHGNFSDDAYTSSVSDGTLLISSFTLGTDDTLSLTGTAGLAGNTITSNGAANHLLFSSSGAVTLADANPLKSSVNFNGNVSWALGTTGTFVHTNLSASGTHLARKVNLGFFAIDGTKVQTTTTYDGTNLAALNTDLKDNHTIGGYYFEIAEAGGQQTLSLVPIPEPSALLLGSMSLLTLLRRRRV